MDLLGVAVPLGVREGAVRQRIYRGPMIAEKRGKKLYSYPLLAVS